MKQLSLDALKFLQKPSVIVALLLSFILMSMSMNYGRLEKEVIEMESKLKKYESSERNLDHDLHDLKNQVKHVEFVEDDLIKKENKLEDKMKHESWGEKEGESHHIHMSPLLPHFSEDAIEDDMKNVLHTIKDKLAQVRENFFGTDEKGHGKHNRRHHFPFFGHDD